VIVLGDLEVQLNQGGVPTPYGLSIAAPSAPAPSPPPPPDPNPPLPQGALLFTYDDQGNPADLPPEAVPIVEAYSYQA
jgi:hypothetical protein